MSLSEEESTAQSAIPCSTAPFPTPHVAHPVGNDCPHRCHLQSKESVAASAIPTTTATVATPPPSRAASQSEGRLQGVRFEVLSALAVPHALYTLPSVTVVLRSLVEQIIGDFRAPLQLCRVQPKAPVSNLGSRGDGDGTTTASPCGRTALEDEDYYFLRHCAYQTRQWQAAEETGSTNDVVSLHAFDGAGCEQGVEEQLCELLAQQSPRGKWGKGMPLASGPTPLLSNLLRYQPLLRDMQLLAKHLLLPIGAWCHKTQWMIAHEDVALTIQHRLQRRRLFVGVAAADEEKTRYATMPAAEVESLWQDLYEVLGAAWRQREQLWGYYRYLHGKRKVSPVTLNGQAIRAVPPEVHAALPLKERYEALHYGSCSSTTYGIPSSSPLGTAAAAEEDTCGFGPFRPADIGVTAQGVLVLRRPMAAVLRSLRVSLPSSGVRDPVEIAPLSGRKAAYQFVDHVRLATRGSAAEKQPQRQAPCTAGTSATTVIPLFDLTTEDVALTDAFPYLSPEVYLALKEAKGREEAWPPSHCVSDDAWNVAVIVIECALCGFSARDSSKCHLGNVDEKPASSQAPPKRVSTLSHSVYQEVVTTLTEKWNVAPTAASNFVYAALYHLQKRLSLSSAEYDSASVQDNDSDVNCDAGVGVMERRGADTQPSPFRLAKEWEQHLRQVYGAPFLTTVLAEVAVKGLCWRRSERWNAFCAAHVTIWESPSDTGLGSSSQDLCEHYCSTPSFVSTPLGSPTASMVLAGERDTASQTTTQRLDRTLATLQTPLLPFVCPPNRSTRNLTAKGWDCTPGVVPCLQQWLKQQRSLTADTSTSSGGGSACDTPSSLDFIEVLRLLRSALVLQARQHCGNEEPVLRYRVAAHPFLRGIMERHLLSTYTVLCGCATPSGGTAAGKRSSGALPGLELYIPGDDLLAAMTPTADFVANRCGSSHDMGVLQAFVEDAAAPRPLSAASPLPQRHRGKGVVSVLTQQHHSTGPRPSSPAPRSVLGEVRSVMSELDGNIALQLHHCNKLRRLMFLHNAPALVRLYLSRGTRGASTDVTSLSKDGAVYYAIPPTLRGEVWGCLLDVPHARQREVLYSKLQCQAFGTSLWDRQLAVDIPRCHQYDPSLASSEGHAKLRRIIKAWLALNPKLQYWQGLDSVCAVLLSVSFTSEALVLAQLQQLVLRFIAHDDGGAAGVHSTVQHRLSSTSVAAQKSTMSEQLHLLRVLLRYCDPLLAHHLFDVLGCTPELFAIRWLVTLFSHGLPLRKVYVLWDLLLMHADMEGAVVLLLSCAVMMQRRTRLLSEDFSGCLAAFSSGGGSTIAVGPAVQDTRALIASVPPSVLRPPRQGEAPPCWWKASTTAAALPIAVLRVADLVEAVSKFKRLVSVARDGGAPHWSDSGVYLVDLRRQGERSDAVLGAMHLPLEPPAALMSATARDSEGESELAEMGWGIVGVQEQLQEQQEAAREAVKRQVEMVAAEVVRQLRNTAVAAIAPRPPVANDGGSASEQVLPSVEVSHQPHNPIVMKMSQSPHVVLIVSCGKAARASREEVVALDAAFAVGVQLSACGVHNVSVLLGGVEAIRQDAPSLLTPVQPERDV